MVAKSYLRYESAHSSGVVNSAASLHSACAVLWKDGPPALVCPALETVAVTSLRTGERICNLVPTTGGGDYEEGKPISGATNEVTSLLLIPNTQRHNSSIWILAVGYGNGHVAVFESSKGGKTWSLLFYSIGHRKGTNVLSLAMDADCFTMASAGQDTDITIWDVTAQDALYRLKGHRGGVVGLAFVQKSVPQVQMDAAGGGFYEAATNGDGTQQQLQQRLVSASADGLLKVWDLGVQQCVQTVIVTDTQITSMCMDPGAQRIVCGLRENLLKVYSIEESVPAEAGATAAAGGERSGEAESGAVVKEHGVLKRKNNKAVTTITLSHDCRYMAVVAARSVEMFQVLSVDEIRKKLQRKKKRRKEKQQQQQKGAEGDDGDDEGGQQQDEQGFAIGASEEIIPLKLFNFDEKIRSVSFVPPTSKRDRADSDIHFAVFFSNNSVKTYTTQLAIDETTGARVQTLELAKEKHLINRTSHGSDILRMCFTSDDMSIVSLSAHTLKQWNVAYATREIPSYYTSHEANEEFDYSLRFPTSLSCATSIDVPPDQLAQCFCVLPGDQAALVGTQEGTVLFAALNTASFVGQPIHAHVGSVNDIKLRIDLSGVVTVGNDRCIHMWEFVQEDAKAKKGGGKKGQDEVAARGAGEVCIRSQGTVELSEVPLCIELSPDGKLVAVALQNYNVQLFYNDTMKPFLTLYGHKLPVVSIAFSLDCTIVATASMDKSLRFWGTDFGDCHRSLHAHDEYVTGVTFVGKTHHCFTVSLDGSIKQWDADHFTFIQSVNAHQRGIFGICVNSDGSCVATGGKDQCIRTLLKTEEMLFPQEEEERRAQLLVDEQMASRAALQKLEDKTAEVGVAGEKTAAMVGDAENLMSALDLVSVELQRQSEERRSSGSKKNASASVGNPANPVFKTKTVWQYLWGVIEGIKPSHMRHVLSSLTSVHCSALLSYMERMADENAVLNFELASRCLLCLTKPAPGQNTKMLLNFSSSGIDSRKDKKAAQAQTSESGNRSSLELLQRLRRKIGTGLRRDFERLEYVTAGMKFVQRKIAQETGMNFFDASKVQGHRKRYHVVSLEQEQQEEEKGGKKKEK